MAGPGARTKDISEWDCKTGQKLIGLWLYGELGKAGDGLEDARYWIGQNGNNSQAMIGTWDTLGWGNFIPLEKLEQGVYLRALFGQSQIEKILENEGTWPPTDSGQSTFIKLGVDGKTKDGGAAVGGKDKK